MKKKKRLRVHNFKLYLRWVILKSEKLLTSEAYRNRSIRDDNSRCTGKNTKLRVYFLRGGNWFIDKRIHLSLGDLQGNWKRGREKHQSETVLKQFF